MFNLTSTVGSAQFNCIKLTADPTATIAMSIDMTCVESAFKRGLTACMVKEVASVVAADHVAESRTDDAAFVDKTSVRLRSQRARPDGRID